MKHQPHTRKHRAQELLRLIKEAEQYQFAVRSVVRDLSDQYQRSLISQPLYRSKIKEAFGTHTPVALLCHYDDCIKRYRQELRTIHQQETAERISRIHLFILFAMLLGTGILFSLAPYLTGFFSATNVKQELSLLLTTAEDTTHVFDIPADDIQSLAISGTLEGDGEARVYLDNTNQLVYDSNQQRRKKGFLSTLTGFLSASFNQTKEHSFVVTDENDVDVPHEITQDKKTTTFSFSSSHLSQLHFDDLAGTHLRISTTARGVVEPEHVSFTKNYAVDTSAISFQRGTITSRATGTILYQCRIWDFDLSVCLSGWQYVKALAENQDYTVSFESGIVALAEGSIRDGETLRDNFFFPLEPLDIAANNVQLGDVVKFDILVKNLADAPVHNATAHLLLADAQNTTIADLSAASDPFEPGAIKTFKLYWDTEAVAPGTYSGLLLLAADGKTEEKTIRMQITQKKITASIIDITGKSITDIVYQRPLRFFSEACIETCRLNNRTAGNHSLIISVTDAILNITSIFYEMKDAKNESFFENITLANISTIQAQRGKILINTTKITYRDEAKKQHKLKKYIVDEAKEHGENWERSCDGNQCVHSLYSYDKYYERPDGNFDAVENALTQESCSADDELCIVTKKHRIDFKQRASDPETVQITKQDYTVSFAPLQLRYLFNETSAVLSSANPVNGEGIGNQYTYSNIFGVDSDLRLTYLGESLKEEIIIDDASFFQQYNFTSSEGSLFFDYVIRKPESLSFFAEDKILKLSNETEQLVIADQSIFLRDPMGREIYQLPSPFITSTPTPLVLAYVLTKTSDAPILSIELPLALLANVTYPLIIDPTVLLAETELLFDGFVRHFPKSDEFIRTATATTLSLGDSNQSVNCQPGSANICHERVSLEWDVTSIPDNAQITHLNLTLDLQRVGKPDNTVRFYHMDGNSTTYANTGAGNLGFFTDMGNGTNYYNQTQTATGRVNFTLANSNSLLNDLHALLRSGVNMWNFGMRSNETSAVTSIDFLITAEEGAAGNRPSITLVYNLPTPEITLNAPANNSRFAEFINITFNATVVDNEPTIREVVFYGGNTQPPRGEDIIALFQNVTNNTVLQYNWTTPVQKADGNTVLLLHFDNRSDFGENTTKIVDFSNASNNGTLGGSGITNVIFNATGGKLGGAWRFNSSTSGNNRNITFGDQDELIGSSFTYLFWINPTNTSKNGTIISKYNPSLSQGLAIALGSNGDLSINTDGTVTRLSAFFSQNTYTHVGITIDSTNQLVVYKNGVSQTTQSTPGVTANNIPFDIVIETNPNDDSFVGYLDELSVLNRTLSAAEVVDRFRLKGDVYFWYVNATDASAPINGTNTSTMQMFTLSMKPNITQISITPSPNANTTDTLNCTFTIADVNGGETLTANVTFYNNSAFFQSFLATVTNGTQAGQALAAGAPARGETWHCGVTPSDGIQEGDQKNATNISIVNSVPSLPVLAGPPVFFTTTNVNPRFNWTSAVDADGDSINYTLNLTCFSTSGGGCTAPGDNRLENVTANMTTVANNLRFRIDDGFYYNWTVRATDGTNESAYAQPRTFNITVLVAIALTTSTVNFQSLGIGQTNDTSDNSPSPFVIENQGNSFIDINLSTTNTYLFIQSAIPSSAFQFKTRNVIPPEGTGQIVNTTRSITSYTNVGLTNKTVIAGFNYTSPANSANIDLNVTVPADEPSGAKGTSILLTGYYIGGLT